MSCALSKVAFGFSQLLITDRGSQISVAINRQAGKKFLGNFLEKKRKE